MNNLLDYKKTISAAAFIFVASVSTYVLAGTGTICGDRGCWTVTCDSAGKCTVDKGTKTK